jgi:hypothetical protein
MKIKLMITLLGGFLFASMGFCDRGLMPFNPNVKIFEPNQRAMIAWDGHEEILLLSTDLSASDSTMVLEVIPLPSEPDVKKGDIETFHRAITLINSRIRVLTATRNGKLSKEMVPTLAGEVTFHERIGAHDISVTHLLDAKGFVDWVKLYLRSLDIEQDIISEQMNKLIEEYIADEFMWFVFDVISLGEETVTNEPIQYSFTTKSLFYPLKITNTGEGHTSIELIILTPRLLSRFPDLPLDRIHLEHDPITINNDELMFLDEDMYELLGDYETMRLRIWKIEGELRSFDRDLIAR